MRTWLIAMAVAALLAPATGHAKPLELVVTAVRPTMRSAIIHDPRSTYVPPPKDPKAYAAKQAKAIQDAAALPPEAAYTQGLDLYTRNAIDGDRDFGVKLIELAAERGNEAAQRKLIQIHPDTTRACYWAEQIAQKGTPTDWLVAARTCDVKGDLLLQAHARGWYDLAAEAGNVDAQMALAAMLVPPSPRRDVRLGLYWYVRAGEAGNVHGMRAAADLYLGTVGEKDPALIAVRDRRQALEWYKRAGEAGDSGAMQLAGDLYMGLPADGDPILATLRDPMAAIDWYKRAALTGFSNEAPHDLCQWRRDDISPARPAAMAACLDLFNRGKVWLASDTTALIYALFSGNGLPQDYRHALELSKRSMDPETNYYRGQILAFGLGGLPADPAFGWHLIEWSAQSGYVDAKVWLKSHVKPAFTDTDLDLTTLPAGQYRLSATLNGKTTTEADPASTLVTIAAGAADYYPERAMSDEVEGNITIYCRWKNDGMIDDCLTDVETPAGYGFANAATKMLQSVKMTARDANAWDQATTGKYSAFIVRFQLQ